MPAFRRQFLLLAIALPLIGQATTLDPLGALRHLPEANPYIPALTRYLSLSKEEKAAITNWVSPITDTDPAELSTELLAIARSSTTALVEASKSPPAQDDIWPVRPNPDDPENPAAILIPDVGSVRELARIAVKVAADSPPADSIEIYIATARLARTQRQGSSLIHHLTGIAIEGMAIEGAARHLLDYSPAELIRLASDWPDPNSTLSPDRALAAERNVFFVHLLENIIIPGAKARLALASPASDASASSPAADRQDSLLASFSMTDAGLPAPDTEAWLARIRAHPQGPDAYFIDLLARYDQLTLAQLEAARRARAPKPNIFNAEEDFVLKTFVPSFERLARNLNTADTTTRMLLSAIHHRLGQLGQSIDPFTAFDPWAESPMTPFAKESTPDGGFILRSRYERRPGEPVTYKFAAPDAGLVRQN